MMFLFSMHWLPFAFFFMLTVELGTSLCGPKFCPGAIPQYSSPTVVIDLEAKATDQQLCTQRVRAYVHLGVLTSTIKDACLLLGRKVMTNLDSILKNRDHYFANKGPSSQGYSFSSGHVWMWELDYKESWAPKNWCFWIVVLEKTLESP